MRSSTRVAVIRAGPGGLTAAMLLAARGFDAMYPCLQKPYSSFSDYVSRDMLRALPRLSLGRSVMDLFGDYFEDDKLKLAFTFQAQYLGVDKLYELPHHTVFFAGDYRGNVADIFHNKTLSEDLSFYVCNPSINDPTLAPEGHSSLYVLIPFPNCSAEIDWAQEALAFRERVFDELEHRAGMEGIRQHVTTEIMYTPQTWQDMNIHVGATFNRAHSLKQMLYFRPHNKFEELDNCYLGGGGTHPGSGLPTIHESGRIAANLIARRYEAAFESANGYA